MSASEQTESPDPNANSAAEPGVRRMLQKSHHLWILNFASAHNSLNISISRKEFSLFIKKVVSMHRTFTRKLIKLYYVFSVPLKNSLLHAKGWLSLDYISLQESEAKADLFPIKLRGSGKSRGRVVTDADSGSGSADFWALTSVFLFLGRQPWRRRPFLWRCFLRTRIYSVRKMTSWILMTIDVVLKHRHSSMSNQLIISHLDIVDHCDVGKWLSFLIKWTRIVHSNGLFKFDDYDTSNGIMEEIKWNKMKGWLFEMRYGGSTAHCGWHRTCYGRGRWAW